MATDNVVSNAGSGGATFRTFSDATNEWPACIPSYITGGSAGAWTVQYVQAANGLPVQPGTSTTWAISAASLPLPTGASTEATLAKLALAQGSTTSGETGPLIQGAVTTAAPTYTTGQTSPLSLSTGGLLRVDGSAVTQPVSGTITANIGTSGSLALDATLTGGTQKTLIFDGTNTIGTSTHPVQVSLANTAANATAVKVDGSAVTQPVSGTVTANAGTGTQKTNPQPGTSGGLSIERVLSAASTNATSVKASAGQVYSIYCHNTNAAPRFLKLYNKASAPTVGTDTPVMTLPIPGNANGAGFVLDTGGMGIAFGTGIALAITGAVTDADTTAVAANEVVVNMLYA